MDVIQITAFLKTDGILWTVLETWGDFQLHRLKRKIIGESWCKNLQRDKKKKKRIKNFHLVNFNVPANHRVKKNKRKNSSQKNPNKKRKKKKRKRKKHIKTKKKNDPHKTKKKTEKKRQILGSCLRTEDVEEHEGVGDTNCTWCSWNGPKETEEIGDQRKNQDHPNFCVDKNLLEFVEES